METIDRCAQSVGANLGYDCIRSLADVDRPLVQRDSPITFQSDPHSGGIWQRGVSASVPHTGYTNAPASRPLGLCVEVDGPSASRIPLPAQSLETCTNANALTHDLSGDGGSVIAERIQDAELQRIDSETDGKIVVELLLRDCHLWHTKSTKGACRNDVR